MQYHAKPCNIMQYHAIPCTTMQYHEIPCNTMQYHAIPACLITADGAYHCPVGSIWLFFQIKSVVVGIAQSTEITTKHSDFAKNLQLSATLVSCWACNSISHFWCKEIQISSAKESRAGSSLEQLQHSLLPSYSKYRGKKYSRGG